MKNVLLAYALACSLLAAAQDETVKKLSVDANREVKKKVDSTDAPWKRGGIYSLNLAQGTLNNWAAGGDNFSIAVNSFLNLHAFYKEGKHSWDNTLDFNVGYLNSSSTGGRKNDDRFDVLSKYGHAIAPKWNISGLVNLRTQFFRGYTIEDDKEVFSSAFLSPAYVLASVGADYKPTEFFTLFMSPVTARWVIVKDDSLAAKGLYGIERGEHSRTEFGAFVTAGFLKEFNKIFSYKARLDLFSNYRHNPEKIDVFLTNVLSIKLSKVLSASWNVDMIYDDDARLFGENGDEPALQIKSLVGVGLMVDF
jgi:hypothetical protein